MKNLLLALAMSTSFSLMAQEDNQAYLQSHILNYIGDYQEIDKECIGFENDHVHGDESQPYCRIDKEMNFSIGIKRKVTPYDFIVQFRYITDVQTAGFDIHNNLVSFYNDEFGLNCRVKELVINLPLNAVRVSKEYNCFDALGVLKRRMTNSFELHELSKNKVRYIREIQNINESGRLNNNARIFVTLKRK